MPDNNEGKDPERPRPPDERRATANDFAVHLDLVDLSLGAASFDDTSAAGSKKRLRRNLSILACSFVAILFVLIMVALMMTRAEDDIPAQLPLPAVRRRRALRRPRRSPGRSRSSPRSRPSLTTASCPPPPRPSPSSASIPTSA
jgi:hypothetical protein